MLGEAVPRFNSTTLFAFAALAVSASMGVVRAMSFPVSPLTPSVALLALLVLVVVLEGLPGPIAKLAIVAPG